MPNTPDDDIESRVSVLEREIVRLRELIALSSADAGAARMLAGGADRDVSEVRAELRAHIRALNALRETQLEHGNVITALRSDVTELQAEVRAGFTGMREGFATMNVGMAQITALLPGIADSEQE